MLKPELQAEEDRADENGGDPPYRQPYRWVMLALVSLLYCSFGIVSTSISPLITPIIKDLHISFSQMGFILGAWPLTYIVVATLGGAIVDRWGIRKSLFAGMAIMGLSAVLRYYVSGFASLFLCVAMFGLGAPMISIGSPKIISIWFRGKSRGTAVGIYTTGVWIGVLIGFSLTNSVVMPLVGYSWRRTFVCYGVVELAAALLWWFLARNVESKGAEGKKGLFEEFRSLARVRNVRLVLIVGFLCTLISHGFNNWLPKILETGGLPPALAGFGASIPTLAAIPTILIVPRLTPPRLRGTVAALGSFVGIMVMIMVATASDGLLVVGLVLYGLCFRYIAPIMMLVLMDLPEVGSKRMGSAGGLYFCIAEIGGFAGPFMVGVIRDVTGSFLTGAIFLACLSLALGVMALALRIQSAAGAKTP